MAALKNSNKLILIFMLCCFAQPTIPKENSEKVTIDNIFAKCIDIRPAEQKVTDGQLFMKTAWDVRTNTGNCGCKSAAFTYRVIVKKQNKMISQGAASTLGKKSFVFLIDPDVSIQYNSEYTLSIDCAN